MKVILLRGLPGSGKTTLARQMVKLANAGDEAFAHVETDDYFINADGAYKFDGDKIKEAHFACQNRASDLLKIGFSVIVANTFSRRWEMEPYYRIAAAWGADVQVITCKGQWGNQHGVPQSVIDRMRERWED